MLCCGGVENARLLLASNRLLPKGVGNQNDLVGRFLMDHIDCPIGSYDPIAANEMRSRFGHYWIDDRDGRHVYEHGLALNQSIQQQDELLNCHAFVLALDPVSNDPWNAFKWLTSARRAYPNMLSDSKDVLTGAVVIGRGLHRRYFKHRPQLERQIRNELHIILEQAPDPASRVTLSEDKRDALGMPISRLHWPKLIQPVWNDETAARSSQLIFQELKRLRLLLSRTRWSGQPNNPTGFSYWRREKLIRRAPPGCPIALKKESIDRHCQVHGVTGLFIAGSSVFPTAGAANPTLMIVAMALRLADRLKATSFASSVRAEAKALPVLHDRFNATSQQAPSASSANKSKSGTEVDEQASEFRELYLPILQQLSSAL